MKMKQNVFSIGDASELTGVSRKKLRRWEQRNYIPKPERIVYGEKSYRMYSETDIQVISRIKTFMDQGYTLSHSSKLALKEFTNQNTRKEV